MEHVDRIAEGEGVHDPVCLLVVILNQLPHLGGHPFAERFRDRRRVTELKVKQGLPERILHLLGHEPEGLLRVPDEEELLRSAAIYPR
jgi:hypothetical protein